MIIFLFSVPLLYAADQPLTLSRVIQIAYKNNKDIRIQEQEIAAAGAGILAATSNFLPHLDIDAGYTRNGAVAVSTAQAKKDPGIFTGYKNDNSLGAAYPASYLWAGRHYFKYLEVQEKAYLIFLTEDNLCCS
ncbi:MAG: TolC family protein [Candidatus Omnitrophica bacterium]|nr:TolC family protein [Candidatus Omnitrophota bacterium]